RIDQIGVGIPVTAPKIIVPADGRLAQIVIGRGGEATHAACLIVQGGQSCVHVPASQGVALGPSSQVFTSLPCKAKAICVCPPTCRVSPDVDFSANRICVAATGIQMRVGEA